MKTEYNWFCYGADDGFSVFNTEEEAIATAESLIEMYRDNRGVYSPATNDYDWDEDVISVCYGRIYKRATEIRTIDANYLDFHLE